MIRPRMLLWMLLAAAANAHAYTCSVSVPAMDFGNYDVFTKTKLTSTTTLAISCSRVKGEGASVSYTVALSTGLSNNYTQRTLQSGTNTLLYNLYQDSQNALIFGDGNGGSLLLSDTLTFNGNALTRNANVAIHGTIPALQDVAVGSYSDQITVTLQY